ncbi:MAG: hypothetical protein JWP27_589 [Flaviaesturariibacter sp.]|nr:hypothetical protein [Flaviaesturariibacter sp.]
MKRIVLTYGLIAGLIVSAFMATSMLTLAGDASFEHGATAMIVGYLGMLISFAFIFVAVKAYRDKENGGLISFGKAFRIGLFISLIASTIYVITWAVVYHTWLPNFMEQYCAAEIRKASTSLSGPALQAKIAEINQGKEMYAKPLGYTLMTYAEILPVGLLVSLVAAAILKRRSRPSISQRSTTAVPAHEADL